jgi:carboxylesterase type B
MSASSFSPICPNTALSLGPLGSAGQIFGDEDCLFLNVYAPSSAQNLPVLVYIHGGGYGAGNGQQDLTSIINGNGNSFIGVAIQYRVTGSLRTEVKSKGVVNAGILDQHFALQWVQKYLSCFGGDPTRVTISGESAGAGSVMLHDIALGGTLGSSLFINVSYFEFERGGTIADFYYSSPSLLLHICLSSMATRTLCHQSLQ